MHEVGNTGVLSIRGHCALCLWYRSIQTFALVCFRPLVVSCLRCVYCVTRSKQTATSVWFARLLGWIMGWVSRDNLHARWLNISLLVTLALFLQQFRVATVREKSGKNRFVQDQRKVSELRIKSGKFSILPESQWKSKGILRLLMSHLFWEGDSLVVKVFFVSKNPAKELISVASLLVYCLGWSAKSQGICSIPMSGNPENDVGQNCWSTI